MNLLTLFVCINVPMGMLSVAGTPFYINGTDNCFFPASGAPGVGDFGVNNTLTGGGGSGNATTSEIKDELLQPTNSTLTDPSFGDDGILNNFFDTVDQAAKSMEIMRHVISGDYITDTIDHFVISCSYDENGTLTTGTEHLVWTGLKTGIKTLVTLLMVFTLFYWATGRGHILTS